MKLIPFDGSANMRRLVLLAAIAAALCIVAAALFLPPGLARLAVYAVAAIPVALVLIDRPVLLFYVLIIILFSNLDLFVHFRIFRIVLAVTALAFVVAVLNGRRIVWHHPLIITLAAVFALLMLQSVSIARDYDAAVMQLGKFYKNILVVAITLQFVRNRAEFRRYVLVMAVAILMSDIAPLVVTPPAQVGSPSMVWEQGVFRYEGFVFEPNQFAMIQLMLVPLLVYLVASYRRKPLAVFLLSASILASVVALMLSFSRGGFVGLAVFLLLLLVLERRNKVVVTFGAVLVVVGIGLSPAIYWERIQSMLEFLRGGRFDLAIYTRIETMKEALRLGLTHPFLGVGVDNFLYALGSSMPYQMIVHNTYLQVFAELGMFALAAFLGIIACNFVLIAGLMRRRDGETAQVGRLLLLQQVSTLTSAFFIPVAYDSFFWFLLAFPAIADYCYREAPPSPVAAR